MRWIKAALIFVFALSLTGCGEKTLCQANSQIPAVECEALVALYECTDGPNWFDRRGWNETPAPCSWHGVKCEDGHVVSLSLNVNGLNGFLPPELGDLTRLQVLVAYFNHLSGPLPVELANTSLQVMILHDNQLSGPILPELGQLTGLVTIDLEHNNFSGSIPVELGSLPNLEVLNLRLNNLSGTIPAELANLESLTGLLLSNNPLSGPVPEELGNMPRLRMFSVRGTQIERPLPGNLEDLAESGYDWFSEGLSDD